MRAPLACFALAAVACAHPPAGPELPAGRISARFEALDGEAVNLAGFRGNVVLVTVLATWTDPAMLEIPLLKELHEAHAPELVILCVLLDEDPRMAPIFIDTFEIPYRVVRPHDPALLTGPKGPFGPITTLPTSVLIDERGRVAARNDGLWAPDVLRRAVRMLLGPQGRSDRSKVAPDPGIQ